VNPVPSVSIPYLAAIGRARARPGRNRSNAIVAEAPRREVGSRAPRYASCDLRLAPGTTRRRGCSPVAPSRVSSPMPGALGPRRCRFRRRSASASSASGNVRRSISIRKANTSPPRLHPKQCTFSRSGLTVKDGVFVGVERAEFPCRNAPLAVAPHARSTELDDVGRAPDLLPTSVSESAGHAHWRSRS